MHKPLEARMYEQLRKMRETGLQSGADMTAIRELMTEYENEARDGVIIVTEGGMVQDIVVGSRATEVMLIDYDVEGVPTDEVSIVEQVDGQENGAIVSVPHVTVDPWLCIRRFARYEETGGSHC